MINKKFSTNFLEAKIRQEIDFREIFRSRLPELSRLETRESFTGSGMKKVRWSEKISAFFHQADKKKITASIIIVMIAAAATVLLLVNNTRRIQHVTLNINARTDIGSITTATPLVYDINGDRRLDIVIGDESGNVHVFDGPSLKKIFQYVSASPVIASPLVYDVNRDGEKEIIAACDNGQIHIINRKGEYLYFSRREFFSEKIYATPAIISRKEMEMIVMCGMGGTVCAIEGRYGLPLWKNSDLKAGHAQIFSSPAVLDINRDGVPDLLIASGNGYISALDSVTGNEIWFLKPGGPFKASICLGNFLSAGSAAALDMEGNLFIIDPEKGSLLLEMKLPAPSQASPAAADVSGGKFDEIAVNNQLGQVMLISPQNRRIIWTFNTSVNNEFKASPIFFDANNDGTPDVIAVSGGGRLYILNGKTGELVTRVLEIGENVTASPVLADINRDGHPDILIAADGGNLAVISIVTSPDTLVTPGQIIVPGFLNNRQRQGNYSR
ncbi:MAG: hypothetical protein A2096_13495 [Spirochaetes bacterium GWF1_41_5]|nr:MAG: hypothetical protein A2096_13495 [Spirochaetes bacterium GWF1_41_5]HBE04699.1 hypothetical protein [Spirochaetia bacterium]